MHDNPYQSPESEPTASEAAKGFRYASWRHAAKRGAILGAATAGVPTAVLGLTVFGFGLAVHAWRGGPFDPVFWRTFGSAVVSMLLLIAQVAICAAGIGAVLVGSAAAMHRKKRPD